MATTIEDLLADEAKVISQIQVLNESLACIRIRMAEKRNINRNAITYNLPTEILSAIFEAKNCLSKTSYPQSQPPCHAETPFEILISSVSRRWRNVALETPRLWKDVQIDISKSAEDLLGLYLCRSKLALLDITFKQSSHVRDLNNDYVAKNFKCYLEQLVPHVARWRAFIIENVGLPSKVLSPLSDLSVPALTRVRVYFRDCEPSIMDVFSGGAPLLSSLKLIGTYLRPPRNDVKSLELGYCSRAFTHEEFTQMMLPMRSLLHLSIHTSVLSHLSHHIGTPITLLSVISLVLSLESHTVGALRSLDLPSLQSLEVRGSTQYTILAFTQHPRSYPALSSLKISYSTPSYHMPPAATIQNFITLFPNVRHVTFDGADPTPILHTLQNPEPLWPKLSVITVICPAAEASFKKTLWDSIVIVVGNRLKLGHPIARIILSCHILQSLTHRQQRGLRAKVVLEEC